MSLFLSKQSNEPHLSVLVEEVVECFSACSLRIFIDGTLGAGGHSSVLLSKHSEVEQWMGIDRDSVALEIARERLAPWSSKLTLVEGNFSRMEAFAQERDWPGVDGILLDLGVSSMQLDQAERGFSFMREGPLDMRMGQKEGLTAFDIVNEWSEEQLMRLIWKYGEESQGRLAARLIVKARPLHTTLQLAKSLEPLKRRMKEKKKIHPATLVFQALRIAVNGELDAVEAILPVAIDLLNKGGRLAVISFHSLEDRLVKECFREAASDKVSTRGLSGLFINKEPKVRLVTRKPLIASVDEQQANFRSRSAKLRIIEKL